MHVATLTFGSKLSSSAPMLSSESVAKEGLWMLFTLFFMLCLLFSDFSLSLQTSLQFAVK